MLFKNCNKLLFLKNNFLSQHIIMKSLRFKKIKNIEENIIEDVRNLFKLKKLKN